MTIPREIEGQKYISLATFRKSGVAVRTPVWFGEANGKLFVMTNSKSGKCKRIRSNPKVRIAACTIRGKIIGPEFEGTARILSEQERVQARAAVRRKYWAARIPFLWMNSDVDLEIEVPG